MIMAKQRLVARKRRAFRLRKKIYGTSECPRLCVKRSLRHINVQIIDDSTGQSLLQLSSTKKDLVENNSVSKSEMSKLIGGLIAEKAIEKGIKKVVFDRKGYPYHGRVKALAEAAREKGLQF